MTDVDTTLEQALGAVLSTYQREHGLRLYDEQADFGDLASDLAERVRALPAPIDDYVVRVRTLSGRFGAMPYGGLVHFLSLFDRGEPVPPTVLLDRLTANLERLRTVLARVAATNEDERSKLYALQSDVAAMRRVLGSNCAPTIVVKTGLGEAETL